MENVKSYLDGELDIAQKAEVETHLRNDAELQKMVEEFSAISTTLKTAEAGEPYGLDKLEARLAGQQNTSLMERKKIFRLASYWSMAGILLAIGAFSMTRSRGSNADMALKSKSVGSIRNTESGDAASASTSTSSDYAKMKAEPNKPSSVDNPSVSDTATPATEDGLANGSATPESRWTRSMQSGASASPSDSMKGAGGGFDKRAQAGASSDSMYQSTQTQPKVKSENARPMAHSGGAFSDSEARKSVESPFKQDMRAKRDGTTQTIPGVPETEHGIYLERMGQVQVKVEDLKRAVNEATGMVTSLDGFVTSSNTQNEADGGVATMTLRVPTKSFTTAIDKLEAMGDLIVENTGSLDITKPTVDNSARMISWADEEKRLIDELNKTSNNDRRYRLKQLIGQARANLEAHKAEVNSLLERAKYSTIELSFVRGDKAVVKGGTTNTNWSGNALKDAKENLSGIGQVLGTMMIYFLVFFPVWLPFVIAGLVIRKRNKG